MERMTHGSHISKRLTGRLKEERTRLREQMCSERHTYWANFHISRLHRNTSTHTNQTASPKLDYGGTFPSLCWTPSLALWLLAPICGLLSSAPLPLVANCGWGYSALRIHLPLDIDSPPGLPVLLPLILPLVPHWSCLALLLVLPGPLWFCIQPSDCLSLSTNDSNSVLFLTKNLDLHKNHAKTLRPWQLSC